VITDDHDYQENRVDKDTLARLSAVPGRTIVSDGFVVMPLVITSSLYILVRAMYLSTFPGLRPWQASR
jgi:hypothetical protein